MKVALPITCAACGKSASYAIRIDESSFDWSCSNCGQAHSAFLDLDFTIGFLLLERSRQELQDNSDYSMCITLSASAFEMELSRMFIKWAHIADLQAGNNHFDKAKCEAALRKLKFIPKLHSVAEMLYPGGIEAFVENSADVKETITRFPSLNQGSLESDFHKAVFKPRNAILHQGDLHYTKEDAERCISIASFGLDLLKAMDLERRKKL
jgi:hypothetical protein